MEDDGREFAGDINGEGASGNGNASQSNLAERWGLNFHELSQMTLSRWQ